MRNRVVFSVIISLAILVVILLALIAIFNGLTNARINQLLQEVTTLKSQATQAAELANSTQSDLRATIASQEVSFTPTVQSPTINRSKIQRDRDSKFIW